MTGATAIERASELSACAHAGQVDKAGRSYIEHPTRVAATVAALHGAEHPAVIVAWLHDVVEDTSCTLEQVEEQFGSAVAAAVDAITRRVGELPEQYYQRVAADELARITKLADIADNADPARLAQLPAETAERLRRKYVHAKEQLGVQSQH